MRRSPFSTRRHYLPSLLVVLAVGSIALAGCATAPVDENPDPQPGDSDYSGNIVAEESPEPTEVVEEVVAVSPGGFDLSGTVDFVTTDGYTWTLDYDFAGDGFTTAIENAPPGFTRFATNVTTNSAILTNTTSGRSAPSPGNLRAVSVYGIDSPACSVVAWPDWLVREDEALTTVMREGPYAGQTVCVIFRSAAVLVKGESQPVPFGAEADLMFSPNETLTGPRESPTEISESEAQTYLDALNTPITTAVGIAGGLNGGEGIAAGPSICHGEHILWESIMGVAIYDPSGALCG